MSEVNLGRMYGAVSRDIKSDLRSIDLLRFDAAQAEAIRAKVRRAAAGLNLAAEKWVDSDLTASYNRGSARARTSLRILGKKPRKAGSSTFPAKREDILEDLVKANASIGRTVDEVLAAALVGAHVARSAQVREFDHRAALKVFEEMGRGAVVAEVTRKELSSLLLNYLQDRISKDGLIQIPYRDGSTRYWDAGKYAKLVARTEMAKAAVDGKLDACKQYDNDLVQVSDEPTDCEDCGAVVGKVYSISGKDPEYPPLDFMVPLHPNCRHDLNPTSREAMGARGEGAPVKPEPEPVPEPVPQPPSGWGGPATSIGDASAWARQNIADFVDFSGASLEIANLINKNLAYMMPHGVRINSIMSWYQARKLGYRVGRDGTFAVLYARDLVTGGAKIHFLFSTKNAGTMLRLKSTLMALDSQKLLIGATADDTVTHELGHIINRVTSIGDKIWSTWSKTGSWEEFILAQRRVTGEVGTYIMTNKEEFVAECYRLYRSGRLPKDLAFAGELFKERGW